MECQLIDEVLTSYHFGSVGRDERRTVEEHLGHCPDCLASYFEIKSNVERPASEDELPRLRRPAKRNLSYAFAAAGLLLVLSLAHQHWAKRAADETLRASAEIDSARLSALSTNFL